MILLQGLRTLEKTDASKQFAAATTNTLLRYQKDPEIGFNIT